MEAMTLLFDRFASGYSIPVIGFFFCVPSERRGIDKKESMVASRILLYRVSIGTEETSIGTYLCTETYST